MDDLVRPPLEEVLAMPAVQDVFGRIVAQTRIGGRAAARSAGPRTMTAGFQPSGSRATRAS